MRDQTRRSSTYRMPNVVILLTKDSPNYNPSREERKENPRLVPITICQSIDDEFHKAFQKIYNKQEVEDSSEAVQEFLDSGGHQAFRIPQIQNPH